MLTQWRAWQQSQGLSERTISEREYTLKHLSRLNSIDLKDVTPDMIIAYCARPELSQVSRASYHATFRAFYKWAHKTGKTVTDPTLATPSPKRPRSQPRPLQTAHVNRLLQVVNRKRTRAMIILATYAGLRVHEIAKFRGEDINGEIITVTGKGGKTAMIPAHDAVLQTAEQFPHGYWFPSYTGDLPHITSKGASQAIKSVMKRAGLNTKPHQLRHWYATELLDSGVDIRVVKDLMRHESIATTEIYTRVSMKQMVAGMSTLKIAA